VGEKGRRYIRRAYTWAELERLLAAAPEHRKLLYQVASLCGFRRKELRKMTKQDCDPYKLLWHPRPNMQKGKRRELIPMSPDCALVLKPIWDSAPQPDSRLFRVPTARTFNRDLAKAKIQRQAEDGRWVDFHSLRYFFCTQMGRVLPIQKVMVLMRHKSIVLTANLYLDLGITDCAEENWTVPALPKKETSALTPALTEDNKSPIEVKQKMT
jgi:integrase